MRRIKSIVSLTLACCLAVGVVAGCGRKNTGETQTTASIPKDVKLTWYQVNVASAEVPNMGDIKGIQEIEKETGIQVEFQHPAAGTDTNEALNLMLASNQLPDIIFWSWSGVPGGISKYISSKTFLKLNDIIDKYCPNYKAVLNKNPEAKKEVLLDDGTIPAFYQINSDLRLNAWTGFAVRGDWLDKLGLKAPTTINEWHDVLTAFKTRDPNGNGKADEIPYSQSKGSSPSNFASAYGILDGMYLDPKTKKVKYGPIESGYKQFITTMAQWYKEGLIDPDFATNDSNAFNAKIQNDIAGSSYMLVGGGIGNITKAARIKEPNYRLDAIANPKASDGTSYSTNSQLPARTSWSGVITNSCKYPQAAAKFMDYLYSEKGQTLINWGIEGESYTVQNGKKTFTDTILNNPQGKAPSLAICDYSLATYGWPKVMDYDAWSQVTLGLDEQKKAVDTWAKLNSSLILPSGISFTSDESSQISDIMNDINTYVQEEELKFTLGTEPLSNLDSFVSKIKGMNIADAVKIYQQAVDRFNKRK